MGAKSVFTFPNPVNEVAARVVAGVVTVMCLAAIVFGQPWVLVALAYGFWARVLTGPTLSPLGQLATKVVAPKIGVPPRLVPGPPKRFAQAMGAAFSTTAVILWFGLDLHSAALVVTGLLAAAAFLESVFALCLGCKVFNLLIRLGVIPDDVCQACADVTLRHAELKRQTVSV